MAVAGVEPASTAHSHANLRGRGAQVQHRRDMVAVAYALANAPLPKSSARWSCRRAFVHYYCCETCTVGLLMGNWTTF